MKLLALVTEPVSIARYRAAVGGADRGAAPRPAVLEEPRPLPAGAS